MMAFMRVCSIMPIPIEMRSNTHHTCMALQHLCMRVDNKTTLDQIITRTTGNDLVCIYSIATFRRPDIASQSSTREAVLKKVTDNALQGVDLFKLFIKGISSSLNATRLTIHLHIFF